MGFGFGQSDGFSLRIARADEHAQLYFPIQAFAGREYRFGCPRRQHLPAGAFERVA